MCTARSVTAGGGYRLETIRCPAPATSIRATTTTITPRTRRAPTTSALTAAEERPVRGELAMQILSGRGTGASAPARGRTAAMIPGRNGVRRDRGAPAPLPEAVVGPC